MKPNPTPEGETMEANNPAGRSDEQRVKEVWPDATSYVFDGGCCILPKPSVAYFERISGWFDVESSAWHDAASRLPKAEVAPEHPRADCEGCGDPNCPCNLIDADGFLEWWRDNNQRFEASDSFTHPIDYAAAAWNAAKASSPAVAGGESEYARGFNDCREQAMRIVDESDGYLSRIEALQPLIKDVRGKE